MDVGSNILFGPPEARQTPKHTTISTQGLDEFKFLQITDAVAKTHTPNTSRGRRRRKKQNKGLILTEMGSSTHPSSGDPCLDFFFHIIPNSTPQSIVSLLSAAWAANPSTTLRLICNLRGVRGTGKADRESFYTCALWLHFKHPKTLAFNAGPITSFGYLKDFPEILHRLVRGGSTRLTKPFQCARKKGPWRWKRDRPIDRRSREERMAIEIVRRKLLSIKAAEIRRSTRIERASRAIERYNSDPNYRRLHDCTSDLFASLLAKDLNQLQSDNATHHLSLAAKWCPSLDKSYDRSTLLCEAIACRLFPKTTNIEYVNMTYAYYAYIVRERLRKEVLVPLRKVLELPEVYIGDNLWCNIPYNRVASVAMKNYKPFFLKYDEYRFQNFLSEVKEGKEKIMTGALLPHEILQSAEDHDELAQLQWKEMVSNLTTNGKLKNCIAVCDVSASMAGTPMMVCIALGLLVSELSEKPWRGHVITFSSNPEIHRIKGRFLKDKIRSMKNMDCGKTTDFQKVFDKLLEIATESNIPPNKMVKRVFVFSDMEFDKASSRSWKTDYQMIRRKFKKSKYRNYMPELVFWNLRASKAVPVQANQEGVALISGFSKNMLKLFLQGDEVLANPKAIMEQAISGKEYEKLVVYD
ncbi:hypothetical protein LUZ60_014881 [Juncus effusus]|nr:hypothetical protein LUZ60_014881 [Juncus effusus]